MLRPLVTLGNAPVASFYDRVAWLYPLVDWFCSPGRRNLIEHINREPTGRLLEIGVGPGRHLRLYRTHEITAIDCSVAMVDRARRHAPNAAVRRMDGERLDFPDASFDYVVLCHVLSVTADPARMLAEVHRVLRPRGRLFVLNHETPPTAWRYVDALLAPLARRLRFQSRFRVEHIHGIGRFRTRRLAAGTGLGLMNAYSFEK